MAKELPYFQFEPAEYLTKDISFCSLSAQGLFINLCSYYWQRECKLTKEQLLRRLNHPEELDELIDEKVISVIESVIKVSFLDDQYEKATKQSNTNSINGSKGGRPKKENQTKSENKPKPNPTKSEPKGIREDKRIEDDKIENNIKEIISEVSPLKLPFFFSWLEYRKSIKKEVKVEKTLLALKNRLNRESVDKCEWVINNSIENGYQGLLWDNYKGQTKTNNRKATYNNPII